MVAKKLLLKLLMPAFLSLNAAGCGKDSELFENVVAYAVDSHDNIVTEARIDISSYPNYLFAPVKMADGRTGMEYIALDKKTGFIYKMFEGSFNETYKVKEPIAQIYFPGATSISATYCGQDGYKDSSNLNNINSKTILDIAVSRVVNGDLETICLLNVLKTEPFE